MPVSYTHLDVYKRQALYTSFERGGEVDFISDYMYQFFEEVTPYEFYRDVFLSLIHI